MGAVSVPEAFHQPQSGSMRKVCAPFPMTWCSGWPSSSDGRLQPTRRSRETLRSSDNTSRVHPDHDEVVTRATKFRPIAAPPTVIGSGCCVIVFTAGHPPTGRPRSLSSKTEPLLSFEPSTDVA